MYQENKKMSMAMPVSNVHTSVASSTRWVHAFIIYFDEFQFGIVHVTKSVNVSGQALCKAQTKLWVALSI